VIGTAHATANPFPGLRAFEPDEDYLFFGREKRVDEILSKLRRTHFLSVVGGSGSGKSSLVRAGLIPALHGGSMVGSGSRWRIAMFRPGEDPLGRMAASLADCGLIDNVETRGGGKAMIEATLRRSSLGLVEAHQLAGLDVRDNLLVLVDQFEELFRYRSGARETYQDDAVAFVKLLLAVSEEIDSRIYVALTMRSDFIGNCADYPGLPAAVTRGQYLVPRMTRSEMRDAIIGPISVAHTEIAPRLVVRLLNDAGEDPDQLPVLQHALMRTWDYWSRDHQPSEPLDIRHYEAIGTMAHALSLHADEAFAELTSDRQRTIAEKAFKALTQVDEQGRGVRRPTSLRSICEIGDFSENEVTQVLERFRETGRGFLSPPPSIPLQPGSMIDLAHESLMRVWNRLQTWVTEEQQAAELYVRLSESALRHANHQQSLWRHPELGVGQQWLVKTVPNAAWASRYRPGFEQAVTFLQQSRQSHKKRRFLFWAYIASVVLIVLTAIALYALLQRLENTRLQATNQQLAATNARQQDEINRLLRAPAVKQPPQSVEPIPTPRAAAAPIQAPINSPVQAPVTPPPVAQVIPQPPPQVTPSPEAPHFDVEMVTAHNEVRRKLGLPDLQWSPDLAAKAQKWADVLAATGQLKGEGITGQNVGWTQPPGALRGTFMVVQAWADGVNNYDYDSNTCIANKKCRSYVQIVWRDTTKVGCGAAHDATYDFWVCNYDPPGNVIGARPY
jgi:uncharacterized protein YkwD/energy-coupling factor transporter ATP-binding protein EcfA2